MNQETQSSSKTSKSSITPATLSLETQLELFEFSPGRKAAWGTLATMLPDISTAMFFAKAFKLDAKNLSEMLGTLFNSSVLTALQEGGHSTELQDYLVGTVPEDVERADAVFQEYEDLNPDVLTALWEHVDITLASSIQEVADRLSTVLDKMPGKTGAMAFASMYKFNRQRPGIGTYEAYIQHPKDHHKNLVILDVSGSMSERTVRAIVDDVVALSVKADAALAIVSNSTYYWEPGTYSTRDILNQAAYGGTHYETLRPLFDSDWGTVVTIADYDSSPSAMERLALSPGRIGKVVDVSLVGVPTYLAQCVGQLADKVEPILVARDRHLM